MKQLFIGALFVAVSGLPATAQTLTPEAEAFCGDARLKALEQKDCRTEMRWAKTDKQRQKIMRSYYWVLNDKTPLRNDLRSEEAGVKGARR